MASALCEASSRFAASSQHIAGGLLRRSARHAPSPSARASPRPSPLLPSGCRCLSTTPALHARLIQRPQRPYQFTQIVQLSDGSTYMHRTTSPYPLHRSTKDSRNHIIWQPSDKSLRNLEVDEAGRLAAFRNRFGHGWDAETPEDEAADAQEAAGKGSKKGKAAEAAAAKAPASDEPAAAEGDAFDSLADLLSGYAAKVEQPAKSGGLNAKEQAKLDRKKKK